MPSHLARAESPGASDLLWVTARRAGGRRRVIVEVTGEVDHYTAPLLGDCLHRQCGRRGLRELVVDMGGATFLAGAGLTVLAQTRQRCSTCGVRLVVWGSGRAVLRSLQLAGLSDLLPVEAAVCRCPEWHGGERSFRNVEEPWGAQ
jgi:anti-sigma B factor antagonist